MSPTVMRIVAISGVLIAGSALRLGYLLNTDLNDRFFGGLWFGFVRAIQENSYVFPAELRELTADGAPFAYPPLTFYLTAALSDVTGADAIQLINLLPAVASIASIFAFYWLACELTSNRSIRILTTAGFAFIPSSYEQQHVPAGLAEAFGTLILILLAGFLLRALRHPDRASAAIAGATGALALVISPGSAVATFLTIAAVGVGTSEGRKNYRITIRVLGTVLAIALLLSSWYWLTNVARHGPDIFYATFEDRTGGGNFIVEFTKRYLVNLRDLDISGFPLLQAVAVVGILELVRRKQFFMPVWLLLVFSVPQEASWLVSVPAGFATGFGIVAVARVADRFVQHRYAYVAKSAVAGLLLAVMVVSPLADVRSADFGVLTEADVEMIDWVRANTEESALVLLVPESGDRGNSLLDWFPHEAERITLDAVGGTEFALRFNELAEAVGDLRECEVISCVAASYLFQEGPAESTRYVVAHPGIRNDLPAEQVVFENESARVIRLR